MARATQLLTDKFGQGDMQLVLVVSAPDGVNSAAARAVGTQIADQLAGHRCGERDLGWTAPPAAAAGLVNKDGRSGLIVAGISGERTTRKTTPVRYRISSRTTATQSPCVGRGRDGQCADHQAEPSATCW